ncbi:unnamed protein product [Paramecium octaurelia]|uniref:Uncharacterized protein n=1 Tax=Paramecium octaurelia TaxID=43137 RepID=A0A8S1U9Q7_PAROT|nr:unnamed protein product [Paramecium octaurelia]
MIHTIIVIHYFQMLTMPSNMQNLQRHRPNQLPKLRYYVQIISNIKM